MQFGMDIIVKTSKAEQPAAVLALFWAGFPLTGIIHFPLLIVRLRGLQFGMNFFVRLS